MYIVKLKQKKEARVLNGYPWIFANEVEKIEGKDVKGAVCRVVSNDGRFVCLGFINHLSKILVRVLTFKEENIDYNFFYERIKAANDYRLTLNYGDAYRAVFSESDGLPGLIVDRYGKYLCVQFLCLGIDVRKELIIKALIEVFSPLGIYERSDVAVREKEGLQKFKGAIYGDFDPVVKITENGLEMLVDMAEGQKTGYFLDQKENRKNVANYVRGKTVLDCFSNIGGFSLCAAKYGAKEVTAVDISEFAVNYVLKNAELNGLNNVKAVKADVFEKLREYKKSGQKFGVVILDPPAFTKSADTVKDAVKGYKDINILGLKLVEKGGYLITCSCSQHLTVNLFMDMLKQSVIESGVKARLIELRYQSKDHANLITSDEALYLKAAVIRVE